MICKECGHLVLVEPHVCPSDEYVEVLKAIVAFISHESIWFDNVDDVFKLDDRFMTVI